jgi:adenine-specific DNA-methyltransferase
MFLSEVRGLTPTNFWSHEYAGHTDEGTRDLAALIGDKVFDNPKPVKLMKRVLEHATDKSSLVLDFFAGTGTMAQAVLELNAEDGGTRGFIAVQVPEACPARSPAAKAGFSTIADLCKERIRRAGAVAASAARHPRWDGDIGFRVLKVDSTNMTDVRRAPDLLAQADLALVTETVKPGRTAEDLLFEVLINRGLDLSAPVVVEQVDGVHEVFLVGDGALIACLSRDLSLAVVSDVARRRPSRAVFLDSGFAGDADRINAEQAFARVSPGTEVQVI